MTNALKTAALAATATLASACSTTGTLPPQTQNRASPYSLDQSPGAQTCKAGEDEVASFMSVDDDFGYGVAVCIAKGSGDAEDRIAVIFAGEGGNLRTECVASECDGLIGYSRYTRPRFTELKLKWSTPKGEHTVVETFDAELVDAPPENSVRHYWPGQEAGEAVGSKMVPNPNTDALALMMLEESLPSS